MQNRTKTLFGFGKRTLAVFSAALALTAVVAACGGGEPEELTFHLEIRDGALVGEDTTYEARQNDMITMELSSDAVVNYHLHGYDLEGVVGPDMPATIEFDAYATGSFPFTAHVGGGEGGHSHGGHDEACEAELAPGQSMPLLSVSASPAGDPHLVEVSVETENVNLAPDGDHWHLRVNGDFVGMYADPRVTFDSRLYQGSGHYEIMVNLNNAQHCDYGIQVMTSVTLDGGDSTSMQHTGTPEGTMAMDHTDGMAMSDSEQEEEIELGRLVVQPR